MDNFPKLDPKIVKTILTTRPENPPHSTRTETLEAACADFTARNGDAMDQALNHLKGKPQED